MDMKKTLILMAIGMFFIKPCFADEKQTSKFDRASFAEKISAYSDPKDQESLILKELEKFPNEPELYMALGAIYNKWAKEQNDKYYDAENSYKKVLQLSPNHLEALNGLGGIYFNLNQYDKAEEKFKKVISINPDFAPVYVNYGMLKAHKREFKDAIEIFKKAISLDSSITMIDFVHTYLGDCYGWLQLNDEAISEYERACELNPNNIQPHLNLGSLYCMKALSSNDESLLEKGESHFNKVLELSPGNKEATQGLAYSQQAKVKIESKSPVTVKTSGNTVIVFPKEYEKQAEGFKTELDKLHSKDSGKK